MCVCTQDLIIFPGDAELSRVGQCTTGRVYMLKFRDASSRRFFYWMQEPKESKDEDLVKKVCAALKTLGLGGSGFTDS